MVEWGCSSQVGDFNGEPAYVGSHTWEAHWVWGGDGYKTLVFVGLLYGYTFLFCPSILYVAVAYIPVKSEMLLKFSITLLDLHRFPPTAFALTQGSMYLRGVVVWLLGRCSAVKILGKPFCSCSSEDSLLGGHGLWSCWRSKSSYQ